MSTIETIRDEGKRLGAGSKVAVRVLPAIAFILAPFFLFQAPLQLLARQCNDPQTKRAGAIGIAVWLAIAYAAAVLGGLL